MKFVDASHGWFIAGNVVWYTADGGNSCTFSATSWPRDVSDNPLPISGADLCDANNGWALADGFVLHTVDGGKTWASQTIGTYTDLLAVDTINAKTAVVVGDVGGVYRTTDGGATWVRHNYGGADRLTDVAFADSTHGVAVGGGQILWTASGGVSSLVAPKTTRKSRHLLAKQDHDGDLTAADQAGGSELRELCYHVDGGPYEVSTEKTATATVTADLVGHSLDGEHDIYYDAVGRNSALEGQRMVVIKIDTQVPVCDALKDVKAKRGRKLTLSYGAYDYGFNKGSLTITLTVRNRARKVVKAIKVGVRQGRRLDSALTCLVTGKTSFICKLARGTYTYTLTATDAAGNRGTSPAPLRHIRVW